MFTLGFILLGAMAFGVFFGVAIATYCIGLALGMIIQCSSDSDIADYICLCGVYVMPYVSFFVALYVTAMWLLSSF